jgi:hypothetical protein
MGITGKAINPDSPRPLSRHADLFRWLTAGLGSGGEPKAPLERDFHEHRDRNAVFGSSDKLPFLDVPDRVFFHPTLVGIQRTLDANLPGGPIRQHDDLQDHLLSDDSRRVLVCVLVLARSHLQTIRTTAAVPIPSELRSKGSQLEVGSSGEAVGLG